MSGMFARERVQRIVLIRTDRLGETLLTMPAVVALHASMPAASLTLLVHPDLQPLMASVPGVDEVLPDQPGPRHLWWVRALALARRLKSHRFDLAIVSNPKKELHLAVWLAGIPVRVGYDRKWGGLLTHRLPDRKALGERHEVEYNLDVVRALGLPISSLQWQLPRFEREQLEVLQLLEQLGIKTSEPFIAVHPWTSNPAKRWPVDRYRTLMERAVERLSVQIVVIGGPEEADRVSSALPDGVPVANLVGRLTLRQLVALLQRTRLLISNDSGPVHLAAAVNTPVLALFGSPDAATGPQRWGPWGSGHAAIWKPSIEAIAVDEVLTALRDLLERPDGNA